jgi:malate dehydrogenase (oxaloacetate-decarboxylating)(NADP+)
MIDRGGVIHSGRDDLNKYKQEWALETDHRTLLDACTDADVFIGLSGPNLMSVEALKAMAPNPIVFALSNPDPEIDPVLAHEARPDIIMATGRSDYPNQVNNVLGFPFIFRGALDVRATHINTEMKMAAVKALAAMAKEPVPDEVLKAYGKDKMEFGPEYIIPTPLDPRLPERIPQAIAQAAIDSGVARIKPV